MAYSISAVREMIIKSIVFQLLVHLLIVKVIDGCSDNLVPCLNQSHCIDISKVCIGNNQCVDQHGHTICHHCHEDVTDSIACVTQIEPQFTFECLSPEQICDKKKDCLNNEDEDVCDQEKCAHDSWLCGDGKCIKKIGLCDGHRNCPDNSDEDKTFCRSRICGSNKFHCRTGECILKSEVCDGIRHCPDNSDEENCPHLTSTSVKDSCSIPSNTFICSSSAQCISNDRVCDGYQDCPMGDDERNCNEECTSNSKCMTNSNVKCLQHPAIDQICRCTKEGYRLTTDTNNQTCQDFDECKDSSGIYCSFNCTNTDGSFNCACPTGFIIDPQTKTCRKINDQSKANLLILHDDNISLYNILNLTDQYSLKLFKKIPLGKHHSSDRIQYDPNQMFVIYYDHDQHAILCKSSITFQSHILLPNITTQTFAYNANEKTLFIIESQSQTLRMYKPITCEITREIKMHSWNLNNHSNAIQSMEIDVDNRMFLFATQYDFLVSNMSEPNTTNIVYSSDRKIKRFIYDRVFRRIFWTAVNKTDENQLFVHTCDSQFQNCLDTSITLSTPGPFAFFNDGLLFSPVSSKSLNFIQIYGKNRFMSRFLISIKENIHSFVYLHDPQPQTLDICTENSCKDQVCLQVNVKEIKCLSTDENLISDASNNIPSNIDDDMQSLIDTDTVPQKANQKKKYRYRPSNTILFCIITLGIIVTILAFFVKRCHKRLNQKAFEHEQRHHERCLANSEPNLDEFNVVFDNRSHDRLPLTNQLHY